MTEDDHQGNRDIQRLAILTNIVAPYRLATWDAIARRTGSTRVLLCAENEANRIWNSGDIHHHAFTPEILPGRSLYLRGRGATLHWNPSIWKRLRELRPTHLIVGGYDSPTHLMTMAWARLHRVPCVMWTGSHSGSHANRDRLTNWLRQWIHTVPDAFLAYGNAARANLEAIGVDHARISVGFNSIDVAGLARHIDHYPSVPGQSGRVRFLYVGQLVKRKGVRQLIEAFRQFGEEAELSIVGYGEEEESLRALVRDSGHSNIRFEGPTRTVEETASYYARADILVMPSLSEVWGLVVNEALAAGLFVVASATSGVTRDLIDAAPSSVGISYDSSDPSALASALRDALRCFQKTSRADIIAWGRSFTPERYAQAAVDALKIAERGRSGPSTGLD